jgi:hypothetical protein
VALLHYGFGVPFPIRKAEMLRCSAAQDALKERIAAFPSGQAL